MPYLGMGVKASLVAAGCYVVEALEERAPAVSPEEEVGIAAALETYRQERVVDAKRAREIVDVALGR